MTRQGGNNTGNQWGMGWQRERERKQTEKDGGKPILKRIEGTAQERHRKED